MITEAYTHNGEAHEDDFLATCLILSKEPNLKAIYRKPSQSYDYNSRQLDNAIWYDVGGQYTTTQGKLTFDHHQIKQHTVKTVHCAFTELMLYYTNDSYADINMLLPQFAFVALNDNFGPKGAAEYIGLNKRNITDIMSQIYPSIASIALRNLFAKKDTYIVGEGEDSIITIMRSIGDTIFDDYQSMQIFYNITLPSTIQYRHMSTVIIDAVIAKGYGRLVDMYLDSQNIKPLFIVSRSSQNKNCWTAIHSKWAQHIDLKGLKYVPNATASFLHASGFFAAWPESSDLNKVIGELEELSKRR